MIEEELTALLGSLAAGGISPEQGVQNPVTPYIVYDRTVADIANTLDVPGIEHAHFELSIWSTMYGEAAQVAQQIKTTMQGWSSTRQNVLYREFSMFEPDVRLYRAILEYSIWYYDWTLTIPTR